MTKIMGNFHYLSETVTKFQLICVKAPSPQGDHKKP
jgi:hypothetical protein